MLLLLKKLCYMFKFTMVDNIISNTCTICCGSATRYTNTCTVDGITLGGTCEE